MQALDCECGGHLEAADQEELEGKVREHVERDHPEIKLGEEEIRELVSSRSYEA